MGEAATDGEVFNVGYGESVTINSLIEMILELGGSNSEREYTPTRAGDVLHSLADSSKLRECGWTPKVGFKEGLRNTVNFYFKTK